MPYIYIDPDGSSNFGLGVVVHAKTGVEYGHQCDGYACDQRKTEGFYIPLGGKEMAQPLIDWFAKPKELTPENLQELGDLVAQVPCWYIVEHNVFNSSDSRDFLSLDTSRPDEIAEAWIPVITPYGSGVLVFENKD